MKALSMNTEIRNKSEARNCKLETVAVPGFWLVARLLDLRKALCAPDRILSAVNCFSSSRLSPRQVDVAMATPPSDKTVFARSDPPWERAILRKSSLGFLISDLRLVSDFGIRISNLSTGGYA